MGTCGVTHRSTNRSISSITQSSCSSSQTDINNKQDTLSRRKYLKQTILTLKASLREIDSGLCVNKGDVIEITQYTESKWSFQGKDVNYTGNSESKYLDVPIGALMLRVSSDREVIYFDKIEFIHTFKKSGRLLFYAHLNEEKLNTYKPEKELVVRIKGIFDYVSQKYPFRGTEERPQNILNTKNKQIEYLINQVRINPKKYFIERILYAKYLHKELSNNLDILYSYSNELPQVQLSDTLTQVAQSHANNLEKSSLNGKLDPNDELVKKQLTSFEYSCVILFSCEEPVDIILELLNHKQNKETILQKKYNLFGIAFQSHLVYQQIIVILFGKKNE